MLKRLAVSTVMVVILLLASFGYVLADEIGFDSTAAEEEGYWYSRYNLGALVMMSGMGDTFMPDMQMVMQALAMADADFDGSKTGTDYGDGDHPVPPKNPALLQTVYKSGDPHFVAEMDVMDLMTQRWDPSTFDTTLTGLATGFTIVKEIEWAKQFHADEHFGKVTDDFGAQWRFMGIVLVMEAKMQANYFLQHRDEFDLSDGGDYVMLWALSDLGKTLRADNVPKSETNRYRDPQASEMFLAEANALFGEIGDKTPTSLRERSLAIQSLVWFASAIDNETSKAAALLKISELANDIERMSPATATEMAYALRGLIEAKRVLGIGGDQISELASEFLDDFDDSKGIFQSQTTYTIDDVAEIVGALNAMRIFESANIDAEKAEEIFTRFFEAVVNKAGLQQSAPPLMVGKDPFEVEGEPEIYFRYPEIPMPPMAGGEFGIAPVFATSVKYENGVWSIVDGRFDTAGAMHASNEMIWLHYDEINGFPVVDVGETLSSLATELSTTQVQLTETEAELSSTQQELATTKTELSSTQQELADAEELASSRYALWTLIIAGVAGLVIGSLIVWGVRRTR